MSAGYKVVWSSEAERNLASIIAYLESRWSQKEANDFLAKLRQQETIISRYPLSYPLIDKEKDYRRSVFTKQITIFYKFEGEYVKIYYLFDTRQDPDKLKL